jgi:hypothetical protein
LVLVALSCVVVLIVFSSRSLLTYNVHTIPPNQLPIKEIGQLLATSTTKSVSLSSTSKPSTSTTVTTSVQVPQDDSASSKSIRWFNRRIEELQFPANCADGRRFIRCGLGAVSFSPRTNMQSASCGFGCQFHHLVYCIVAGIATNRTGVFKSCLI